MPAASGSQSTAVRPAKDARPRRGSWCSPWTTFRRCTRIFDGEGRSSSVPRRTGRTVESRICMTRKAMRSGSWRSRGRGRTAIDGWPLWSIGTNEPPPNSPRESGGPTPTLARPLARAAYPIRMSGPTAVVLLSGGMDSATATAIAKADGLEVIGLTIDYGQRHRKELDAAKSVAKYLGVKEHRLVRLDLTPIGGSALTDRRVPIPEGRPPDEIRTPLIRMTKADIVRRGVELGVPWELTWSCYHGRPKACGVCDSCQLRLKGFREAGVRDPIPYERERDRKTNA